MVPAGVGSDAGRVLEVDRDGGGVLDGLHALTPAGRRPGDKDLIRIGVSNKKDDVIKIQVYENMTH